jgi:DNA-binding transcriptional MerR regulator
MDAQQQPHIARAKDTELTIREVCDRLGLTLRALRFYEVKGLLNPRRANRSRFYSEADMQRLDLLLALKAFGFSLEEIRALLCAPVEGRRYPLTAAQCERQIVFLRERREKIDEAISLLSEFKASLRVDPLPLAAPSPPLGGLQPKPSLADRRG